MTYDHAGLRAIQFYFIESVQATGRNRGLREDMYHAWVTRASDQGAESRWDNSSNIDKILSLRHEAAQLVGFTNYAEYSLATKMAESSEEVIDFLRELAARTHAAAKAEVAELSELAKSTLEPWDLAFWLEKLKQTKHSISNEELRQYFPVKTVISGLFELAERLYGVELQPANGVSFWHDDVQYYEVRSEDKNLVGGFYTDLFARTGKRSGAWIDECISRKKLNGIATLPVGYLVCNFSPRDESGEALLTHDDVDTLFHEFGHMLHHLLTRIDYPSIAGINGVPWDAVELPSQFMENFAWHYDVLQHCSSHTKTGDVLPREMFELLNESRHTGAALAMMRQIEFGLFDFRLHSEYNPETGARVLEIATEVRDEVSPIGHPHYNRMAFSFLHIFAGGYAAGYYSYKWAEVLAADAFGAFEEAGILDRDTAQRFRNEILEVGGSRDIMQAYIAFRGRKPTIDALLQQSGIEKP